MVAEANDGCGCRCSFAALNVGTLPDEQASIITRLRLDAQLYRPAPLRPKQMGRPRKVGKRLPGKRW